jgi:hypothetical protein
MVIAIARTIPKINASLSGFRAMSASWSQIDVAVPDTRRETGSDV